METDHSHGVYLDVSKLGNLQEYMQKKPELFLFHARRMDGEKRRYYCFQNTKYYADEAHVSALFYKKEEDIEKKCFTHVITRC